MNNIFSKSIIERYSRQIILKDIGPKGQKNIIKSKVLIVGSVFFCCPIIDYLSIAGVNNIVIADHDKVSLSNLHRQNFYDLSDFGKFKVDIVKKKLNLHASFKSQLTATIFLFFFPSFANSLPNASLILKFIFNSVHSER